VRGQAKRANFLAVRYAQAMCLTGPVAPRRYQSAQMCDPSGVPLTAYRSLRCASGLDQENRAGASGRSKALVGCVPAASHMIRLAVSMGVQRSGCDDIVVATAW